MECDNTICILYVTDALQFGYKYEFMQQIQDK